MSKLKILVDADACPVKDIIESVAKKHKIELLMFIDTSHELSLEYGNVITVSKGRDSADFALINVCNANDIVVTQDYGLAAMAIAKKALVISPSGTIYDDSNILFLLSQRDMNAKARKARLRIPTMPKRNKYDDQKFNKNFTALCAKSLKEF